MASGVGDLVGLGVLVIVVWGGWTLLQSGALNFQPQQGFSQIPSFNIPTGRSIQSTVGTGGGLSVGGGGGGSGGGGATGFHAGCSPDANPGGNSPGWYTEGANSSGGAGWTGRPGHHHCDWKKKCCFCTDVKKCIAKNVPPFRPGDCRPDWGTTGYLGGGRYPSHPDFSKCPAGTGP